MALLDVSTQVHNQLGKLFETMRSGQAPDKFTRQFLKDLGFKSSNHHAFIPLLKGLGFLTADGSPTPRYKEFLDKTKWKRILAEAIREAYGDLFVLKAEPGESDRDLIAGKFKSTFNYSDLVSDRAARTFLGLVQLADQDAVFGRNSTVAPPAKSSENENEPEHIPAAEHGGGTKSKAAPAKAAAVGLHYNLQIHLPPTKDVEVYNAIFKSMREHLID